MKPATSDPLLHIPSCKIRGRLIPAYDFLPRLRTLCFSLGFKSPIVTRSGEAAERSDDRPMPGFRFSPADVRGEQDHIVIYSAVIPYEQNWGAYTGLPGQRLRNAFDTGSPATPADFIDPYVHQYRFAREHIHLGCDSSGRKVVTLPEALITGKAGTSGFGLQVDLAKIAGPDEHPTAIPASAGSRVSFPLSDTFQNSLDDRDFSWQPGVFRPIGEHLSPELFSFITESRQKEKPPFPEVMAVLPSIVAHKTPHLAATLVHLHSGFSGVCEAFAATGPDDLRNLICVAGLEIDMKGFRGRKQRYFVPWQACWKRHGYCYGNIYPLLQDDLLVALMNYNRMGSGADHTVTDWP